MGQKEKLILLDYLEFTKSNKGKTSGSRVMFTSRQRRIFRGGWDFFRKGNGDSFPDLL